MTAKYRSANELPGLKHFRSVCLICLGNSLAVLLAISAITFLPSALWIGVRAGCVAGIVALYFCILALRTQIIIYQASRNRRQTFDRPAPEWITVLFILGSLAVIFWPH